MTINRVGTLPTSVANLQQYTQIIQRYPMLDATAEYALAERLKRDNDPNAAAQLVTSHLRYVLVIARGYQGYGLPQEDLIQEGTIGLIHAVRRFDPARGVRLLAYASYWIRALIHDYVLANWRLVKVTTTKARRKLFYRLRRAKKCLDWLNASDAQTIADELNVRVDDVIDMEGQLYLHDESIDGAAHPAKNGQWSRRECLTDRRNEPETVVSDEEFFNSASKTLHDALSTLDGRSREIIERRWLVEDGERQSLRTLGEQFGISAERVRQLEANAIGQLRKIMSPHLELE